MRIAVTSMRGLIVHVLRVALFLEKEERISRGEFIIASLFILFVWSLIFFIDRMLWSVMDGGVVITIFDVLQGLSTLLFIIPIVNLMVKRLKDLDRFSRGWFSIFIPYASAWMVYDRGTEGKNRFGDDPLPHVPQSNGPYWLLGGAFLIFSLVAISVGSSFVSIIDNRDTIGDDFTQQ